MQRFRYETNGYNRNEVNKFVESVISKTEGLIENCRSKQREIEELKREIEHYKRVEYSLKEALKKKEESSNEIKRMAQGEAKMIITDAKYNASRIVNESLLQAEKIDIKKEAIENHLKIMKRRLKLVVEQQNEIVEEIEVLDLE